MPEEKEIYRCEIKTDEELREAISHLHRMSLNASMNGDKLIMVIHIILREHRV